MSEEYFDFKVAKINDLVLFTIYPILRFFNNHNDQRLRLSREKEFLFPDSPRAGKEEFVMVDRISLSKKTLVLIVEGKTASEGEAKKLCFLYMEDMRENTGGGTVDGFITMGDSWRMVSYDGTFVITGVIQLTFDAMATHKLMWMESYSMLVDCFNVALSDGSH
ncbi:hypothetical protein HOY80DRAFT_996695 [Tuber brumale]|nr:hypothetical protein HOY80DRAFT_996695 [Tuber brumale]